MIDFNDVKVLDINDINKEKIEQSAIEHEMKIQIDCWR